jgi:hypothetical protein
MKGETIDTKIEMNTDDDEATPVTGITTIIVGTTETKLDDE